MEPRTVIFTWPIRQSREILSRVPGLATPVRFEYHGKEAVAIFAGERLLARELKTGEELWSIPWKTKSGVNACDPLFMDDDSKVYVSSRYGLGRTLYDISGDEPKSLWSGPTGSTYSSSVYLDSRLYTLEGFLAEVDPDTGKRVTRGPSGYSVLVVGGHFVDPGTHRARAWLAVTHNPSDESL